MSVVSSCFSQFGSGDGSDTFFMNVGQVDLDLYRLLHQHITSCFVGLMWCITDPGEQGAIECAMLSVFVMYYFCHQKMDPSHFHQLCVNNCRTSMVSCEKGS